MSVMPPAARRIAAQHPSLPPGTTPKGPRGAVLSAALGLFAEKGFAGASIRDIAAAVGVKAASIYSHYASKDELLAELLRIGHTEHQQRIRTAVAAASPQPCDQLEAFVRAHVGIHTDYPMLAIVSNSELHSLSQASAVSIMELRTGSEELLLDIIERGIEAKVFDVPHPWLAIAAIGGMGLRVAYWYTPDFELSPQDVASTYVEYARRILGIHTST